MMPMTVTASKRRRLLVALLLGAAACWLAAPNASAHAAYESSSPVFAEVLPDSPTAISIRFTQELFRRAGANALRLQGADTDGAVWERDLPPPHIDNKDRRVMRVSLDIELSPGRYLVSWINLSAEDGDADAGAYPFYVSREPTAEEIAADRELAAALLIRYPGDQTEASAPTASAASAGSAGSAAPTVVRSDPPAARLGAGPIVWLTVGLGAALALTALLAARLRSGRRIA